jgi:hypothetical protein
MMLTVLPDWVRVVAVVLIWLMFPLMLWSVHRTYRLHQRFQEGEEARRERWQQDLAAACKMREEAYHLRAQAEVALAQARQQMLNDKQGS